MRDLLTPLKAHEKVHTMDSKIHDYGYSYLFEDPEMVHQLLETCVDEGWVKELVIEGIEPMYTAYIVDTFPVVRKHDEKAHGEYRTKRVILERYDALAEAARSGQAYETTLDPPPADSRVAHPPRGVIPDREGAL